MTTLRGQVFDLENVNVSFRKNAVAARSLKYALVSRLHGQARAVHAALSGVSLSVTSGERLGVIGRNGAGKSTLLRVLARVIVSQHGRVTVDPTRRVVPLLELGLGFQPDLSGAENCFLSGTLLGLTPACIEARLEHIVRFAELDGFIDEPVKHYSSGMYARLAFALAFDVEPDVLLVDEFFGVGFHLRIRDRALGARPPAHRTARPIDSRRTARVICRPFRA